MNCSNPINLAEDWLSAILQAGGGVGGIYLHTRISLVRFLDIFRGSVPGVPH